MVTLLPKWGMGSRGFLAGNASSVGRVLPADTFRDGRLRLLRSLQEADIRRSRQKMRVDGDRTPQVGTSVPELMILILARCPWAFSPAPFGSALLALVPTVQPMPARCKYRPRVDDDPLCP
jgi:hypothetical protein